MWRVPTDLLHVAERIAQAEDRIGNSGFASIVSRTRAATLRKPKSCSERSLVRCNSSIRISRTCAEARGCPSAEIWRGVACRRRVLLQEVGENYDRISRRSSRRPNSSLPRRI